MFDISGDVQVTHGAKTRGMARLFFQLRVEIARVAGEPQRGLVVVPSAGDQAGRMPRRSSGELMLFEEEYVGHTELGEVVGNGAPDHSATDDDYPRTGRDRLGHDIPPELLLNERSV